jgi:L-seryl-tRNA(Ser) seleniumtransferase
VQEYLAAGVDLVCFSGDKLMGGPQAGIIAGRTDLVGRLKRHPLCRALRLDKVILAGVLATLQHYRLAEAEREVPVWRMIGAPPDVLATTAERWAAELRHAGRDVRVVAAESAIGGGSLPGVTLPTHVLSVAPRDGSPDLSAAALRENDPPVIVRIAGDRLLIDPRTVPPADEGALVDALGRA